MTLSRADQTVLALAGLKAAMAAAVWKFGAAGPIALHFDLQGQPDRWGDRNEAALVVLGLAVLGLIIGGALGFSARRKDVDEGRKRGLELGRVLSSVLMVVVAGLIAFLAWPGLEPETATRGVMPVICLMMAGMGAWIGKLPPNALIGVRTPWSVASRLAWDKSNRLAGRLFLWGGLLGAITLPFLPLTVSMPIFVVATLGAAALSAFESWRVWATDPDRRTV